MIERLSLSKAADAINGAASDALFACRSWRSIGLPASAAYVCGALALLCFAAAVRNVPFPFGRAEVTLGQPRGGEQELEELISYLKEEQGNTAPWIAGGLSGSDYQDARAEMDAWAVAISRRLRKYDQELARVFNEDDRRYTSLDLQAFLDRRLQQLRRVITVLERRRDSA